MEHTARPELLLEFWILGIVGKFRFLFRIQVIQVAEELVEAMHGRQVFIPIAQMVLAELPSGVSERLEHFGDGRIFLLKPDRGTRHPDFRQSGTNRVLARDETRATCGAALL